MSILSTLNCSLLDSYTSSTAIVGNVKVPTTSIKVVIPVALAAARSVDKVNIFVVTPTV